MYIWWEIPKLACTNMHIHILVYKMQKYFSINNKKCLDKSQLYSCAIGFSVFVLFLCILGDLYRNLSFLFSVAERMIWSCSSNWKGWFFIFFRTCCCDDVIVSTISLFIPTEQWLWLPTVKMLSVWNVFYSILKSPNTVYSNAQMHSSKKRSSAVCIGTGPFPLDCIFLFFYIC